MESVKPKKQKVEPGPELPQDDSQAGVQYLNYEELQPLSEEQLQNVDNTLVNTLKEKTSSEDWKAQYEAVNILRSLSKFHRDILVDIIAEFSKFIAS